MRLPRRRAVPEARLTHWRLPFRAATATDKARAPSSVRSSAPPSCSTTCSAATSDASRALGSASNWPSCFTSASGLSARRAPPAAIERLIDIGEIEDMRAMHDRRAELDRLDRILPAMLDQRSAHEHDRRQPVEQSQFAHGVGDVDIGGRGRQFLARAQRHVQAGSARWCGRSPRRDRDAAARSRSTAAESIRPASGAHRPAFPLRRDAWRPRPRSGGRASPPSAAPAWRGRRAAPERRA